MASFGDRGLPETFLSCGDAQSLVADRFDYRHHSAVRRMQDNTVDAVVRN